MNEKIEELLNEVLSLVSENRDYERAIEICDQITDTFPLRSDGLRQRAWVFSHKGDLPKALGDISKVIEMGENDPHDYALRGRWYLGVRDFKAAVKDQTKVIEI